MDRKNDKQVEVIKSMVFVATGNSLHQNKVNSTIEIDTGKKRSDK